MALTIVTPRACVVGWPIKHSRSPLIHGYWLKTLGIAGSYDRRAVTPEDFPAFLKTIGQDGLLGANVTVPHKEAAFALCGFRTEAAQAIGAVNTLWWDGQRLGGDNTDASGFSASLDDEAPNWRALGGKAVVLGAGGAARAVIHALRSAGMRRILVANRSPERSLALAGAFSPDVKAISWDLATDHMDGADVLVNTTSLGMEGQPPLAVDLSRLPPTAVVADVVYTPLTTPLVASARERGLQAVGGRGMLLHQAASGFERWFGVRPIVTAELRALVEADVLNAQDKQR